MTNLSPSLLLAGFLGAALAGVVISFFTDRVSAKRAIWLAVCVAIGTAIGRLLT